MLNWGILAGLLARGAAARAGRQLSHVERISVLGAHSRCCSECQYISPYSCEKQRTFKNCYLRMLAKITVLVLSILNTGTF